MMKEIVKIENVDFSYRSKEENIEEIIALKGINLNVAQGEFVSVLGRNGSGKSTLAKLINALLLPTNGTCYVRGMKSNDNELRWEIRKICGMVFQNPDNQIVGTTVEEDVAFGLENIGVPSGEIRLRIDEAMKYTGIYERKESAPHLLSGGQKQRVAIAGILAMNPECVILDEATAMLDPVGRKEVMSTIKKLNEEQGVTILHITHHMDEAVQADRVIVIDDGKIVMEGTPKEIFSEIGKLKELGLDVPQVTEVVNELRNAGLDLPKDILTVDEAVKYLKPYIVDAK